MNIRTDERGNQWDENGYLVYKDDDCDMYLPEMEKQVAKIHEESKANAVMLDVTGEAMSIINTWVHQNNEDAKPHLEELAVSLPRLRAASSVGIDTLERR